MGVEAKPTSPMAVPPPTPPADALTAAVGVGGADSNCMVASVFMSASDARRGAPGGGGGGGPFAPFAASGTCPWNETRRLLSAGGSVCVVLELGGGVGEDLDAGGATTSSSVAAAASPNRLFSELLRLRFAATSAEPLTVRVAVAVTAALIESPTDPPDIEARLGGGGGGGIGPDMEALRGGGGGGGGTCVRDCPVVEATGGVAATRMELV